MGGNVKDKFDYFRRTVYTTDVDTIKALDNQIDGEGNTIGGTNTFALGGSANTIATTAVNTVVLGGQNISATASNRAYAQSVEVTAVSGVFIFSQNGTKYMLTVNNNGSLTALPA